MKDVMNKTKAEPIALGQTLITLNARNALHPQEVLAALWRHANEPWGDSFFPEQKEAPGTEVRRLVSSHLSSRSEPFKIATETERGVSTVYLAAEKDLSCGAAVQESVFCICQGCGE